MNIWLGQVKLIEMIQNSNFLVERLDRRFTQIGFHNETFTCILHFQKN